MDPYTIGGTEINYRSLVIGGLKTDAKGSGSVYRGDSFICPAAIHAGVIADGYGGAGVVSLIGEQRAFPATESNGISSVAFGPSFPLAFTFLKASGSSQCSDPRWRILIFSSLCTALLSLFTTSTLVFYCTSFVGIYFTVALATDPSDFKEFHMVVSYALGNFLPCAFIGLIIYRYCVMRTLHNLRAQYEKTVLWLGACWVGALNNYTFDRLPIQRLTPHDIKAQPGALTVVIFLSLAILAAALGQIWAFRIEGRLLRYLAFYALLGLLILGLILIPGMNLRLHHYIIALLLLPGTAIQTRPSLLYQGLLVGLFINGIARWGFDSILQTPAELFKTNLNDLVPQIAIPKMEGSNITFNWDKIASGYDSISILINDVERFRGYEDHNTNSFSWERYHDGEPEYFRFGYVKYGQIGGSKVGKYTHPGVWEPNGTWAMVPISYPTHPSSHRGGPYRGGVGDFINHLWDGLGPVNRV